MSVLFLFDVLGIVSTWVIAFLIGRMWDDHLKPKPLICSCGAQVSQDATCAWCVRTMQSGEPK